mmetsp:Transcript_16513/g.30686  ORF Transcript_16513/g.30686 Transcript_16513/m.30686 type:complete len:136 (-) Transcript_16513:77-484(-)
MVTPHKTQIRKHQIDQRLLQQTSYIIIMPEQQHKEWFALDHFHQKWNDLDGRAREAAAVLEFTPDEWDAGRISHLIMKKNWGDLDAPQKDAAHLLGLDENKWNQVASNVHKVHPSGAMHEASGEEPSVLPSPFET